MDFIRVGFAEAGRVGHVEGENTPSAATQSTDQHGFPLGAVTDVGIDIRYRRRQVIVVAVNIVRIGKIVQAFTAPVENNSAAI